jgi:hypothetical protein
MTLEQYASLAQIAGIIVVAVTLVFLAIQSRQNGALLRSEARRAQVSNDLDGIYKLVESSDIVESFSSDGKLEYQKKVRLYFWLVASCRAREHEWFEYRNGVLDDTAWKSYSKVIPWIFGTPRNRRYWEYFRENFDPEFVKMVNAMIEASPGFTEFWKEFAELD